MSARVDPGVKLFFVVLVAILTPAHIVAWCLYALGVALIISFLVLMLLHRGHDKRPDAPGWAKVALAPLSGFLKFNLILVIIGLAVLWQFHPLWGGA